MIRGWRRVASCLDPMRYCILTHCRQPILALCLGTVVASLAARAGQAAEARELIRDPRFQRGFVVLDPKPGKKVMRGSLRWGGSTGEPLWHLAQWTSRYSIAGAVAQPQPGGAVSFANQGKMVAVAPAGHPDADLVLAVRGSAEYRGRARRRGEPWPHLLVSQRFQQPPRVTEVSRAVFRLAVRLRSSRLYRTSDYSERIHAAQFLVFVTVQNLNRQSPGYGRHLWFGIPLYDDRHRLPRRFEQPDSAGKFIYTPPGEAYTRQSVHDGAWVKVERDVMPLIKAALDAAWARGFLSESTSQTDYYITAMNMGWEVPGILNVEMQVRDLGFLVTPQN